MQVACSDGYAHSSTAYGFGGKSDEHSQPKIRWRSGSYSRLSPVATDFDERPSEHVSMHSASDGFVT